jgi:hypothetical protein
MKSGAGKSISIDPAKHAASAHGFSAARTATPTSKSFPHPAKVRQSAMRHLPCRRGQGLPRQRPLRAWRFGVRVLSRQRARTDHRRKADAGKVHRVSCRGSNRSRIQHSRAGREKRRPRRAEMRFLPRPIHAVKASSEADSTVARKNMADTCAKCHSDAGLFVAAQDSGGASRRFL